MSQEDYRIGRAYTMINKYVSSAAHLQGKSLISCEELTNTDRVFNETLELLKVASDQSIISGVTHAVFHGFNYSPKEAKFPGYVQYGTFLNERNPLWPYINYFTNYRARLSFLLQQGTMYAEIAILSPIPDMWSIYGAQNEPFPTLVYPPYQTLIWEAIHKNGNGCDYVSERIIQAAEVGDGYFNYGSRKYHTLFLIKVESIKPESLRKLYDFINTGGKVFSIEKYPDKATGWNNNIERDKEVKEWIRKMMLYPKQYILLQKPEDDFIQWFANLQDQFQLKPYVKLDKPNSFVNQIRYQTNESEIIFVINSNMDESYRMELTFDKSIWRKRHGWIWDTDKGERYKLDLKEGCMQIELGPADSKLLVFDKEKAGKPYKPLPKYGNNSHELKNWNIELRHINGSIGYSNMETLKDVKDIPMNDAFCGAIIYRTNLEVNITSHELVLNLGKVYGVSDLSINGIKCGVQWFGNRIYAVGEVLKQGINIVEIKVVTTMGNYMKSLKDNPVAQYWTNEKLKNQPIQSMGMIGPVTIY